MATVTSPARLDLSRGVLEAVYDVLAALPGPREGRVWPAGDVRTAFENAVVDAQLHDFHFHDLRHHFASWYSRAPCLQRKLQRKRSFRKLPRK
jgi:hypothetical protein